MPPSPPLQPALGGAWLAYKPGIIGLRPQAIGDLLTGALNLIKFNWRSTLGLSAIVETLGLLVSVVLLLLTGRSGHRPTAGSTVDSGFFLQGGVGTLAPALVNAGALLLLAGLLAYVCAEAVLGRRPGPAETWRAARRRIWPFIGAQLVVGLAEVAGYGIVVLFALLVHTATRSFGATVAAAVVLGLGATVALVWVTLRLSFTGSAIMLEGLGVRAGLSRSWNLTRGGVWRILGTTMLASMITGTVASMLTTPAAIISLAVVGTSDARTGLVATLFAQAAAQAIAYTLVAPFSAGVSTLLYLDRRMRREGLDIQLLKWADQGWAPWRVGDPARPGAR